MRRGFVGLVGLVGLLSLFYSAPAESLPQVVTMSCDAGSAVNGVCQKCSLDPSSYFNSLKQNETLTFVCNNMKPSAPLASCWVGQMSLVVNTGQTVPGAVRFNVDITLESVKYPPTESLEPIFHGTRIAIVDWISDLPGGPASAGIAYVPQFGSGQVGITWKDVDGANATPSNSTPQLSAGSFLSIFLWPPPASTCPPAPTQ
jgi:hypothetical protein